MKYSLYLLFILICGYNNYSMSQGSVEGTLCYPSYYLPEMIVYLKNIESNQVMKIQTKKNQQKFKFKNVPNGKYVIYAYTIYETMTDESGIFSKGYGGYTQMVPCGLTVECEDHTLIEFEIETNKKIKDIAICDWYGAIVPEE